MDLNHFIYVKTYHMHTHTHTHTNTHIHKHSNIHHYDISQRMFPANDNVYYSVFMFTNPTS